MQVCVTGANGFIGRQLIESLSNKGFSIRVLTRQNKILFPVHVEVLIGDLTLPSCPLNQFLKDCDVLFHCAGEIHEIKLMHILHVEGTSLLLKAALNECDRSKKKIHWVHLSSCGVYGPPMGKIETNRVINELSQNRPINTYESTKAISDNLVIQACKKHELLTFSILRPSNVIGSKLTNQSLLKLISMVKKGKFFYLGNAGAITTYVHAVDVAEALLMLAINPRAKGEIYNLSYDCTIEDLINKIATLVHVNQPKLRLPSFLIRWPALLLATLLKKWIHLPKFDFLILRTHYPTTKIESELGFVFSKPLPDAVEELTRTILKN